MLLHFEPMLLELRHPFRLATGTRTHTKVVLTQIHWEGLVGFGEAAMPPYYGEDHETAKAFLSKASEVLLNENNSFGSSDGKEEIARIMEKIDAIAPGNNAAKASVDIALHDLWGKVIGKPLWQLLGSELEKMPATSFTLGIAEPAVMQQKLEEASGFKIIKVKLGSGDDWQLIRSIREMSSLPIYADANQGWKDKEATLDLVYWLQEQNVQLIEQPFHKDDLGSSAWLTERSPLPIFADESFQRFTDLDRVSDCFHGVNIKLMKCIGISEAIRIADVARKHRLKLMIGCMTETSCGIMAAAALAPQIDYADTDGCWLVRNNPFEMPAFGNGRIMLDSTPGLGLKK